MYVNKQGYLERRTVSGKKSTNLASTRTWWFVKYNSYGKAVINVGNNQIKVPEELLGERVCLKLEKFKDESKKH